MPIIGHAHIYDRGGNLLGVYPQDVAERYADEEHVKVIRRALTGEIVRIYLLAPDQVKCDRARPTRPASLSNYTGQHYSFREEVYYDEPFHVWALRETRFMPHDMMLDVLISCGARLTTD